jgi:ApbE superfamily uncharacterized protein (UPF0280 family)
VPTTEPWRFSIQNPYFFEESSGEKYGLSHVQEEMWAARLSSSPFGSAWDFGGADFVELFHRQVQVAATSICDIHLGKQGCGD